MQSPENTEELFAPSISIISSRPTSAHAIRERRWVWPVALAFIGLISFGLRWYYVSTAMVDHPVRGDAAQYFSYAWNLANHGTFAPDAPGSSHISPDNYRDPAYPLFLALWMKLLGTTSAWYAAVLMSQALLGSLTVVLATQLGRNWLPVRWALGAGLMMAVWPHSITITGYLLTETLFGFLCALGLLLCARAAQRQRGRVAFLSGVVFGAAALTNAILVPFGPLLAAYLGWRKLLSGRLCLALVAGALLLPAVWAVRNANLAASHGSSNSSLNRAMQNLVQGASPDYHSAYRNSALGDAEQQSVAQIRLQNIDADYELLRRSPRSGIEALLRRFTKDPEKYAKWYLFQKPSELWGWSILIGQGDIYVYPTASSPFQTHALWIALEAICRSMNFWLMLTALAGIFVARSSYSRPEELLALKSDVAAALVAFVCIYVTLVYCVTQAEPRYSIPFRAFEILLAATSLAAMSRWWKQHRSRKT